MSKHDLRGKGGRFAPLDPEIRIIRDLKAGLDELDSSAGYRILKWGVHYLGYDPQQALFRNKS